MYPNDMRLYRDIIQEPLAPSSAADIVKVTAWGNLGSLGDGDSYELHVLPNASEPTTTLKQQTGHSFPGPFPIGQFTNQNALTGGVGDQSMEMIGQTGFSTPSGCQVFDGYNMRYIGTSGVYSPSNMWSAYSACFSDPAQNMVSETCNSNAALSGIEIAAGIQPEEVNGAAGWTQGIHHALLMETPGVQGDGTISESGVKLRLRVCGVTDYVNPGSHCVNLPAEATYPQSYAVMKAMERYGIILSDNGCCLNLARHYHPQPGNAPFNYGGDLNKNIPNINIEDFDELDKNN